MSATKSGNENTDLDDFESLLQQLSSVELDNINDAIDPEV
jgi:hypothetical protein